MSAAAEFRFEQIGGSSLKRQLTVDGRIVCNVNIDPYDNRFCIMPTVEFASLSEERQIAAVRTLEEQLFTRYAGKYFVDLSQMTTNQAQVRSAFASAGFSFSLADAGAGRNRILQIQASALEAACTKILTNMHVDTSDLRVIEGDALSARFAEPGFVAQLHTMMKKSGFDAKKIDNYLERSTESIFTAATPFCFVDRDNKLVAFCRFTEESGGFYLSDTLGDGAAFMPWQLNQQQFLGIALAVGVGTLGAFWGGLSDALMAIAAVDALLIVGAEVLPPYLFSRVAMMKAMASRVSRDAADPMITCIAPLGGTLAMQYLLGFKSPEKEASLGARFVRATPELPNFPISTPVSTVSAPGPFHASRILGGSGTNTAVDPQAASL